MAKETKGGRIASGRLRRVEYRHDCRLYSLNCLSAFGLYGAAVEARYAAINRASLRASWLALFRHIHKAPKGGAWQLANGPAPRQRLGKPNRRPYGLRLFSLALAAECRHGRRAGRCLPAGDTDKHYGPRCRRKGFIDVSAKPKIMRGGHATG